MFTLEVEKTFTASHQLLLRDGPEDRHEHDWVVKVAVSSEELDKYGLVIDFHELKRILDQETEKFHSLNLEDMQCFKNINVSAENLAKYLFISIEKQLKEQVKLKYVQITEEPGCKVTYSR